MSDEEDFQLRKEIERKLTIQPLAKLDIKEEYAFALPIKFVKNGKTERDMIIIVVEKPVDYHLTVKELVIEFKKLKEKYESVKSIDYSNYKEDLKGVKIQDSENHFSRMRKEDENQ